MSLAGQSEKNSVRVYVFRVTPESGHGAARSDVANVPNPAILCFEQMFSDLLAIVDPQSSHHILATGLAFGPFPAESNSAINDKFVASDKAEFIAR